MATLAMPFLDSVGRPDEHGPEAEAMVRPWMSYWPPESGSELHALLQQDVPEVLSWRFNPKKPFDRPWQTWTRPVVASSKACTTQVLSPTRYGQGSCQQPIQDNGGQGQSISSIPNTIHQREGTGVERQLGTNQIDDETSALKIPFVVPNQLNYLSDDPVYQTTKPFHTRLPVMGTIRRTNIVAQGYSNVKIYNIRGHDHRFTLDRSGFQYFDIPVSITSWTNEIVRHQYLPAMERWLQDFFKAQKVHIFTYSFRCENRDRTSTEPWIGPYMRAHCDVTLNSGIRRLDLHLPDEAEDIKKGRWRMVGLWRALTGPHQDRPLALLDNRSLCQDDLIGADVVFPHYCDEGYEVKYSPLHRWLYKQCMTQDEALMFKLYDSSKDSVRFCPHAAFIDPSVPDGTPQRASIELRAIVIG